MFVVDVAAPDVCLGGGTPSPSSAIRDIY